MEKVYLRTVTPGDASALLGIYAYYVENTAVSFEYTVPSEAEFRTRIEKTLEKYAYIAAVCNGEIIGYAYMSQFHTRAAYSRCAETTIYIKNGCTHKGTGRILYEALEKVAAAQHIKNLYACIAFPDTDDEYLTHNSVLFHTHMGYCSSGEMHNCGRKFDRWYNAVWMEKIIGEHSENPLPLLPFHSLSAEQLDSCGIRC